MIVADTGPIIAFARLGQLELLHEVVGELIIPDAVYEELVGHGIERPGAAEVARGDWIHRRAVADRALVMQMPSVLHPGEREAIVLAQELNAQLLIDEERGRDMALTRGLSVIRSLRVLVAAKQHGHIREVRPLIEELLASGYWIEEDVIRQLLQELGEAEIS